MRLFGLIGYPLTHSFSKDYFAEKFKSEAIDNCRYENFQLADITALSKVIKDHPELEGLNVTIPYKESVLSCLDEKNELVREIGACNCIKLADGKLRGFNTDVIGFETSLIDKLQPHHKNALILGTGGAAKAVEFVLKKNQIPFTYVSRKHSKRNLAYDQVTPLVLEENKLIINTTPVGMFPNTDEVLPLPFEAITPRHFLFDLIYNPAKTLFLKKGEERGAVIQNGYEMLVCQAEESWKIWNEGQG
jgi:shikimate dehydrogenase